MSSRRQGRGWNLNSTDKPCVSIEANIDGKLSTLNQSIMTTHRDETPEVVYKNGSEKQLMPSPPADSRNKPKAANDSLLSGRQTYVTENTASMHPDKSMIITPRRYLSNKQDQEFYAKYREIRKSREIINARSVFDNPVPKISDNFDLMKFMNDNHLSGLYPNMNTSV